MYFRNFSTLIVKYSYLYFCSHGVYGSKVKKRNKHQYVNECHLISHHWSNIRGIVMWQSLLFSQLITNNLSNRCEIAPVSTARLVGLRNVFTIEWKFDVVDFRGRGGGDVVQNRESPGFRSPEVGVSVNGHENRGFYNTLINCSTEFCFNRCFRESIALEITKNSALLFWRHCHVMFIPFAQKMLVFVQYMCT